LKQVPQYYAIDTEHQCPTQYTIKHINMQNKFSCVPATDGYQDWDLSKLGTFQQSNYLSLPVGVNLYITIS
jgi:hypothetical protein